MAVIKSTAYGQARKSVGANNYYRRKGVQLVRSKPTFAPDRQFSHLQLMQQARMGAVQQFYKDYNLESIAWGSNTSNNKRYNASSRANRLIGSLLKNMSVWNDTVYADAYEWLLFSVASVTRGFSVGNLPIPVINDITLMQIADSNNISVSVDIPVSSLETFLFTANKKQLPTNQFDINNIGLCGFLGGSFNDESFVIIQSQFAHSITGGVEFYSLRYIVESTFINWWQGANNANLAFFLSKDKGSDNKLLSPALLTTSSISVSVSIVI